MEQYYIVTLTLPVSTGTCEINGSPGYGSPLSCSDQLADGSLTTVDTEYKFTDFKGALFEQGVHKAVKSVSFSTPKLKAGSGLASRASVSISLIDFTGVDPNPTSPALVADPTIKDRGTYFGKLDERYVLANVPILVELYETDGFTHTKVDNWHFNGESLKYSGKDVWTIKGSDILQRTDISKSQFPRQITERLISPITSTDTQITISIDNETLVGDWLTSGFGIIVIGEDVMLGTSLQSSTATSRTYNVTRLNGDFSIGTAPYDRNYTNQAKDHEADAGVFLGRIYEGENLGVIITDIFTASGIDTSFYNSAAIEQEMDDWISNNLINCIFPESKPSSEWLNEICEIFTIDIFTNLETNQIEVKTTNPWKSPIGVFREGVDFDYESLKVERLEKERFTRSTMRYNKKGLMLTDNKGRYQQIAAARDSFFENDLLYGDEKSKVFKDTIILGDSNKDFETANTSVIRFVNRFAGRLRKTTFSMSREQVNPISLGDVIEIESPEIQTYNGDLNRIQAQVTKITPKPNISTMYDIETLTYNPFSGEAGDVPITVTSTENINLFLLAGSPVGVVERIFIFDALEVGQGYLPQSIDIGSFDAGSTIHMVLINGTNISAQGGQGGNGGGFDASGEDGLDGGVCVRCTEAVTVNMYLTGVRNVGGVNYTCDGELFAPGGGGGGGSSDPQSGPPAPQVAGAGGGGGAGRPVGVGGLGGTAPISSPSGDDGQSVLLGGVGGTATSTAGDGGQGGDAGDGGVVGQNAALSGGAGGLAGAAFIYSGSGATINLYGHTTGVNYIQGNGNPPNFIP